MAADMQRLTGMTTLIGLYVLLTAVWAGLLRLLPEGTAYEAAVAIVGVAVAAAYLVLLIGHVRKALGNRASLLTELSLTAAEAALLLATFASVYQRLGILDNTQVGAPAVHDFWRSLYLSFITFTTVGYGDFYPTGAGRALAALQGLTGYLVLGILASSAASLISPQSPEGPHDDGETGSS